MKKSVFREFVKEMFIDLIENDEEVREIVLEFVQENKNVLIESSQVVKEPANPELYDKLMLIASGQEKKLVHEGKMIKTPNYGNGFKSGKHIKEWANSTYNKIGGKWENRSASVGMNSSGVRNDTFSFLSAMGDGSGELKNVASLGDDRVIRESIVKSGRGNMMALDENGQFDPDKSVDISSLLVDTAKTTLQSFPSSHDVGASTSAGGNREAFQGAPEQVFGESAGNWAALAFQGMDLGE